MMSSKYRKRLAVVVVMILLLLGGVLGVTISYFQDQTDIVKNTFAGGALFNDPIKNFTIVEQKVTEAPVGSATKYQLTDGTTTGFAYTVLPGVSIPKRPYIKVDTLLMDAYLYVVVDTNRFTIATGNDSRTWTSGTGVTWEMASNWKILTDASGKAVYKEGKAVYYYVGKNANGKLPAGTYTEIDIMKQTGSGNGRTSISVDANYSAESAVEFKIDFRAYICQISADNTTLTPYQAWKTNFADTAGIGN